MTARTDQDGRTGWQVRLARSARRLHRWIGVGLALVMSVLAITGGFVAFKKQVEYLQPATRSGSDAPLETLLAPAEIAERALALPGITSIEQLDRIELRPGKNTYKVRLAATDRWSSPRELQFDAATGALLNDGVRGDQLWMDLHSFAVFGLGSKLVVMGFAALALLWLSLSGLYLFFFPPWFRARKRRRREGQLAAVDHPQLSRTRLPEHDRPVAAAPKRRTGT